MFMRQKKKKRQEMRKSRKSYQDVISQSIIKHYARAIKDETKRIAFCGI